MEVYYDQFAVDLRKSPVINATDLYPYGAPAISYSRENSLKQDRLLNGKETQNELGYNVVDLGQRDIDPFVPVFPTIDRFAEKYHWVSPYQFVMGNPVSYIDINGDSAWSVTRQWQESDITAFADYAKTKLEEAEANGDKIDCADLPISILIGYASENGLSLQLTTADGKTTFDSNSDAFTNVDDYKKATTEGLAAKDIPANTFSVPKSERQEGDMILLTTPANHVASYSSVASPRKLTYGNLRGGNPEPVETYNDWSHADADRRGNKMTYYPDKQHVNRWKFLKKKK